MSARWWPVVAGTILVVSALGAGTAEAQQAPRAFVNGDAKASANLFDLKIQITGSITDGSGLAIGLGAGRALTSYQDTTANAEGRALDYSLLSALNPQPTPECPDLIPLFMNDTLPPVTIAESLAPADSGSKLTPVKYAGFPSFGPEFGTQDATAGPGITSHAATTGMVIDSGVVRLDNPRSESTTRIVNGVREAVAVSTADRLSVMGGALTLFNPTWMATARSGSSTTTAATFTYQGALVLGIPRPGGNTADLQAFKGFVEAAFSSLGLKLFLPQATIVPGPNGTGSASISQLTVGMENLPLGSVVFRPILRAISPQIDAALANYLADPCSNPSMQMLADILLGIASGTGGLSFAVGGADAMTDDIYVPPVDFDSSAIADTPSPIVPLAALSSGSLGGLGSSTGSLGTASSLSDSSITPLGAEVLPAVESAPDTTVTDTDVDEQADAGAGMVPASDRSRPGSSGGTAGWVTLLGLGAVAAIVAGDQLVMRRSRKKFSAPT